MIYLLNGVRIHPDRPFRVGNTQYPGNWLRSATPEELAEIGVTVRADIAPPDARWFEASQRNDGTWNAKPRDLDTMRVFFRDTIKSIARERILQICPEWRQTNMIARGFELLMSLTQGGTLSNSERTEVAETLAVWRQIRNVRSRSNQIEADIDNIIDNPGLSYEQKISALELRTSRDFVGWDE